MGCVLCNYLSIAVSECDGVFTVTRVTSKKKQKEFLEELAHDIATKHPKVVKKINYYVRLKELGKLRSQCVEEK